MFTLLVSAMLGIFLLFSVPITASSPGDPNGVNDWQPFGTAGPFEISSDLFATFQLISQYAAVTYCPGNNDSPNTLLSCPSGNCPLVESANATTLSEFEDTAKFDDTGYIALDDVNNLIILAIRGSVSNANWKADWDMMRVDMDDWCPDCSIHRGFRNS
ncbi:MAG: hypothetical protein Q9221_001844 [Calogaya cf. arnoldii]